MKFDRPFYYLLMCQRCDGGMANSVDPDQTPRFAASDLGLQCLLMSICPNIYGKYASLVCYKAIILLFGFRTNEPKHGTKETSGPMRTMKTKFCTSYAVLKTKQ